MVAQLTRTTSESKNLEKFGIQLHHAISACGDAGRQGTSRRQLTLEEETRYSQLGVVELRFTAILVCQRHLGHLRPHVCVGGKTEQVQVIIRRCTDGVR